MAAILKYLLYSMELSALREHVGKPLNKLLMALILSLLPFQALPKRQKKTYQIKI